VLSQSSGQVAHVILTRSPLGLHQCCHRLDPVRLACVRHAASVRPEPGSNSPSRSSSQPEGHFENRRAGLGLATPHRLAQHRLLSVTVLNYLGSTVWTCRSTPVQLPALAFGSHYSVFKERRDTHRYRRALVSNSRGRLPDRGTVTVAALTWGVNVVGQCPKAASRASTRAEPVGGDAVTLPSV
jgi:hypothetical protein